jgi:hypothetical protein
MTTMIAEFSGVPREIVRHGKLKNLSGVALKLYMALWHQSERYRTRMLRCSTTELEELTGCSRNALITARADLARAGLVQGEPHGGRRFVFHLCDPNTGKPWPGDPKQRIIYERKGEAFCPMSSDGERVAKPRQGSGIEPAALNLPQSENHSPRAESIIEKRRITVPISPAMSWDAPQQSHPSVELSLGGTAFPFGFNDLTSNRPGPGMESLRGLFNN